MGYPARSDERRFVKPAQYLTVAERTPTAADYPTAASESLEPGAVVFAPPDPAMPADGA
jgi:sulfatase modifying factor 1